MDRQVLVVLLKHDNWECVELMDNWLFVFDHLPHRMRLYVDFKIQGFSNQDIAQMCSCSINNIEKQLRRAKKRFLRGENVL